ncbi:Multidrug resistance-associated protein 4 [Atta colombica]|uniref:Multidrug resistance-associated protein 4 n=1 Tax=Atta colombica TaxID=520822 RepID=A0A195B562_9HYME|nr:Multidrug resistance-associated protein 4 [Atta colombica]
MVKMYGWEKPYSQIILLGESIVSFTRLENFLLMDEVNMRRFSENTPQLQFKSQKSKEAINAEYQIDKYIWRNGSIILSEHQRLSHLPVYVKLQWISANWISGQLPPTLCNINLSSSKYNFPGNSSTGYFTNNPNLRISYPSQEPWLFSGTVRDNTLFGQPYNKARYMQVANVCALTKDFRQFPQGDITMVGDRGVSLSDRQRERINLTKAFLKRADHIIVLDRIRFRKKCKEIIIIQSNKDFIMSKRITITRRISRLSTTSSITVCHETILEDVRRIENTNDVKQFANMYNNNFLESYTFCIIACIVSTLFRNFLYMKVILEVIQPLKGLLTIRSSNIEIEKLMRKRFDELQDYQRHICLFLACFCFSLIPMNETSNVIGSKAGLTIRKCCELNDVTLDYDIFSGDHNFSKDIIRSSFKKCTVITAHCLNMIIDSNRIIVMENGSVVVDFSILIIEE